MCSIMGYSGSELSFDAFKQALEKTITYAADAGQTEISAILMDERYRSFPKKKKKFVL